jgi:hypothetical protein
MAANQIPPSEPEDATQQPEPLPWGQNLLGIEFLSDDFYEDIPLEFFLGDEESNKFFHPDEIVNGQERMARLIALAEEPKQSRKPGGNLLGITYIGEDFDAPLPEDVLQDFGL